MLFIKQINEQILFIHIDQNRILLFFFIEILKQITWNVLDTSSADMVLMHGDSQICRTNKALINSVHP